MIKIYWFLFPASVRRKCIFKKSCSTIVYEETIKYGLKKSLKTLLFRIRNCNNQFDIVTDYNSGEKKLYLKSGIILPEDQIAKRIL